MLCKAVVLVFVVVEFGLAVVEVTRTKQEKFFTIHAFPNKYKAYCHNNINDWKLKRLGKISNFQKLKCHPTTFLRTNHKPQ